MTDLIVSSVRPSRFVLLIMGPPSVTRTATVVLPSCLSCQALLLVRLHVLSVTSSLISMPSGVQALVRYPKHSMPWKLVCIKLPTAMLKVVTLRLLVG